MGAAQYPTALRSSSAVRRSHERSQKSGGPRSYGDPDRTFVAGGKREYLAISTEGPDDFTGPHPLWNVRQILEKFYDGRRVEGCFAPPSEGSVQAR
jgi:hypothetical protein